MTRLKDSQNGFIITALIIAALIVLGYFTWQNFLNSERGQQIQDTTNKVIDTIDSTSDTVQDSGLIDKITNTEN